MTDQTSARLIEWLSRKASAQYARDIALVMVYGSRGKRHGQRQIGRGLLFHTQNSARV